MSGEFTKQLKEISFQDNKENWFTLDEACNKLNIKRQNLDYYRKVYKKKYGESALQKWAKDKDKRRRLLLSKHFVEFTIKRIKGKDSPFILDAKAIKEENIYKENEKLKAENEKLRIAIEESNLEILEEGLHPQANGTFMYVYQQKEFERLTFLLQDYPRIKTELSEAKENLKESQNRIFALMDQLTKALENTQSIHRELNRIEFEKSKS